MVAVVEGDAGRSNTDSTRIRHLALTEWVPKAAVGSPFQRSLCKVVVARWNTDIAGHRGAHRCPTPGPSGFLCGAPACNEALVVIGVLA